MNNAAKQNDLVVVHASLIFFIILTWSINLYSQDKDTDKIIQACTAQAIEVQDNE